MILAEEAGAVAVQAQHLGQRRDVVRSLPGVAGKCRGDLGDASHVVHVMISTREQRRPRRRAQSRGVKLVEAQALAGKRLCGRHVDRTAEGTRHSEAHVVDRAR